MAGTQEKIQLLLKNAFARFYRKWVNVVPLQSPLLWCKYYRLMGRIEKAEMIEKAIEREQY